MKNGVESADARAAAEASLARARIAYERALTLFRTGAIDTASEEQARRDLDKAEAALTANPAQETRKVEVAYAQDNLKRMEALYAAGVVDAQVLEEARYADDVARAAQSPHPKEALAKMRLAHATMKLNLIRQRVNVGVETPLKLEQAQAEYAVAAAGAARSLSGTRLKTRTGAANR